MLQQETKQTGNVKLLIMPCIDMSLTSLCLKEANSVNTGGFCFPTGQYIYSPIYLCVCGLSTTEKVTDLSQWFRLNPNRIGESLLTVILLIDSTAVNKTITEWKHFIQCESSHLVLKILKKNAPFTFRKESLK